MAWWARLRLPLFVLMCLAFFGYLGLFGTAQPVRWVDVSDFRARWDLSSNSLQLSVVLEKKTECTRTLALKDMRPISGNEIDNTKQLPLNGQLPRKVQNLDLGATEVVFDHARLRSGGIPLPGHYLVTLVLICEKDGQALSEAPPGDAPPSNKIVLSSDPARSVIVVPKIPIRMLPR